MLNLETRLSHSHYLTVNVYTPSQSAAGGFLGVSNKLDRLLINKYCAITIQTKP